MLALIPPGLAAPLLLTLLASAPTPQSAVFSFAGEDAGFSPGFGSAVAFAGDTDADGFVDLIAGGPYENQFKGQAKVYSGCEGSSLLVLQALDGHFGRSVAGAGDVDGDGAADVIIGAEQFNPFTQSTGYARVLSGADGSTLHHWNGEAGNDKFGWSVAGVGDLNGDGAPDLVVGAIGFDVGSTQDSGMIRALSGADGSILWSAPGPGPGGLLGYSVSGTGDKDGDGVPEVLAGATKYGPTGQMRLYSGRTGQLIRSHSGAPGSSLFGHSVADAGDVDGDGTTDVLGGNATAVGVSQARVFSGANGQLLSALDSGLGGTLGCSVSSAGDVDGDGVPDAMVGARTAGVGGEAYVFSGSTGAILHTLVSASPGDRFAEALAAGVDVNGDGEPDAFVGAGQNNNSQPGFATLISIETSLVADSHCLSLSAGGSVSFSMDGGSPHAGEIHLLLGSSSGTSPGVSLGPITLFLNAPDPYLNFTLSNPNLAPLSSSLGILDASGRAQAAIAIPPGSDPALAGLRVHHAWLAISPSAQVGFASAPLPLLLQP